MRKRVREWLQYWPVIFVLLAVVARLVPGPRTIDDAYISFRYARNILAGNGFLYNPGEAVLGTTTPLYVLLMTGLGWLTGGEGAPFPQLALGVNALADGVTCLLLFKLGRRLGQPLAGAGAALAWALNQYSVTFAIGGLETSLVILLLLSTSYAHLAQRHRLAAGLAALTLLARPDTLILLAPLGADRLWVEWRQRRAGQPKAGRSLLPEAALFGLPVLAWVIYASLVFGSPIPHSISAKSVAYLLPPDQALVTLLQRYATPFAEDRSLGILGIWIGIFLHPFLAAVSAVSVVRRNPRLWPLAAYPWLYLGAFAAANPLIFRWYNTPPMLPLITFSLLGFGELLMLVGKSWTSQPRLWRGVQLILLIVLPVGFTARAWLPFADHGATRPAPDMAWYRLELLYQQAAQVMQTELAKDGWTVALSADSPVLAAGDVGVLGYALPLRILDTVGLNSPVSTRYYPLDAASYVINYAIPAALILDQQPDYIIVLEVYGRRTFLADPVFQAQYELRHKIPTDIYGSDGMLIFKRSSPAGGG